MGYMRVHSRIVIPVVLELDVLVNRSICCSEKIAHPVTLNSTIGEVIFKLLSDLLVYAALSCSTFLLTISETVNIKHPPQVNQPRAASSSLLAKG